MNFHECAECHKKEPIKIEDRQKETDDDGAETISYSRKIQYLFKFSHCMQLSLSAALKLSRSEIEGNQPTFYKHANYTTSLFPKYNICVAF